jgi:microcin C transport system ATP-binding protein
MSTMATGDRTAPPPAAGQGAGGDAASGEPLLRVEHLSVEFATASGRTRVVDDVSFSIAPGERFALVGESGSGKTVTAYSLLRLNADAGYGGRIVFGGRDLLAASEREMRGVRGRDIAMVFQEPMSALNPLYSIGDQICEAIELHEGLDRRAAAARALELLERVRIPEPRRRFASLPHQLSGGQRQRAMIAMALACNPRLLVADEPTTALDVTIQRQIVELLAQLQRELGMAVLLITHDLPLVRSFADRVGVMQSGRLLESGAADRVFAQPEHPYTRRLVDSRPRRSIAPVPPDAPVLLRARGLGCSFETRRGWFSRHVFEAVRGVDLQLARGETLGIVGESGSGKTTLGMALLRLAQARTRGEIELDGQRIDAMDRRRLRPLRRRMQVVFQDPYNALSPRLTIEEIVAEGLALHQPRLSAAQRRAAVVAMLEEVGLSAAMLQRYPHEFSGGQRQRIAIARAAVLQPELLLLDEPTSSLDVSVQQQVLELLAGLQRRHGLSYLFITHDLQVVRAMAHRVLVMKDGEVVESGETEAVFAAPAHPYTRQLLAAAPDHDLPTGLTPARP